MSRAQLQALLSSNAATPSSIEVFIQKINLKETFLLSDILAYLEDVLTPKQHSPIIQLNALLALISLNKRAEYLCLTLSEVIFLPLLIAPAEVAASKKDKDIYQYFERQGQHSNLGNLQVTSYHFTHTALHFIALLAYLKPKRFYHQKEYATPSLAKVALDHLLESAITPEDLEEYSQKYGFLNRRKEFLKSVIVFHKHPSPFIDYFMHQLEYHLLQNATSRLLEWLKLLWKEGNVYLTSQSISRLAQILCFHNNFRIKRMALQLIGQMVVWGQLQALLLANYTQYFKTIAEKIMEAKARESTTRSYLFPEIEGQDAEKNKFKNDFLVWIERWATAFPTLQGYFINSGSSPISQLYSSLKDAGVAFPKWEGQQALYMKMAGHFKNRKEYNAQLLDDLQKQKGGESVLVDPLRPSYRSLLRLYDKNHENFEKVLGMQVKQALASEEWKQLLFFAKHFEELVERVAQEVAEEEMESLIEQGLNLKQDIEYYDKHCSRVGTGEGNLTMAELQHKIELQRQEKDYVESVRQRVSSYCSSWRSRDKSSLNVRLSQSGQIVRQKMVVRLQHLAAKRGDPTGEVSQLELNSRPFLAKKIHSRQIVQDFIPLVNFHPLRKQKRQKAGIKLCQEPEQVKEEVKQSKSLKQKSTSTPKFRSVMGQKKMRKGISVFQKDGGRYERYLGVLSNRSWIKWYSNSAMTIHEGNGVIILRQALQRLGNTLQVRYRIEGEKQNLFKCQVRDQPSIKTHMQEKQLEQTVRLVVVTGSWVKFGFSVPIITFTQEQRIIQTPLPFSFNNFLTLSPETFEKNPSVQTHTCYQHPLDLINFPTPQKLQHYLSGMKMDQPAILDARASLFEWYCHLTIEWQGPYFKVMTYHRPTGEKDEDLLAQFLLLYLTRLMGRPKE